MQTLKGTVSKYIYRTSCVLLIILLAILVYIQINAEHRRACEDAIRIISQMEKLLEENQQELFEIQTEYRQTCLHNADAVARILEGDPSALDDIEELKKIAKLMEIDEIHIFDKTGRIYTGTHPQYFDFTFDSGEQMMFFKPMLKDTSLRLVQNITPNTAEQKLMQYSAVWSENKEFIVQVGMEPVNVMKVTKKNELSYIFSLFQVNSEVNYYTIDAKSGEITASSDTGAVGSDAAHIGLSLDNIKNDTNGFHAKINGQLFFCVFKKTGTNYIGRAVTSKSLYQKIPVITLWFFISLIIVAAVLSRAIIRYVNTYVVNKINDVNDKLKSIADGNLEERVDIRSSIEFIKLSNYINSMVKSLLDNNKKISYALSKTNIHIGTYEYGSCTKKVYFTEYIPKILCLDNDSMEQLASDTDKFVEFLDEVRKNPIPDEPGVYYLGKQYIQLEEIRDNDEVFGVVVDVTAEIEKRQEIEKERDIDSLTGLYNRRALDIRLDSLFSKPEALGHSALIIIDADGLKSINDTYGHEKGDLYIKKIAQIISDTGTKNSIASRQGGDEFVLLLYGYDSKTELMNTIEILRQAQSGSFVAFDETVNVPLRFSLGYCLVRENAGYQELLREADEKMYKNKLERKKGW